MIRYSRTQCGERSRRPWSKDYRWLERWKVVRARSRPCRRRKRMLGLCRILDAPSWRIPHLSIIFFFLFITKKSGRQPTQATHHTAPSCLSHNNIRNESSRPRGSCSPFQSINQSMRFPFNLKDLDCFVRGACG